MMEEKKKSILVVDDEIIGAMSLAELVRTWGFYDCEIAGSAEEALKQVENCRPDLIVMDVKLGENTRGGIEAAKKILTRYKAPIIFISGYEKEEVQADVPDGLTAFLNKPLDLELLKTTIKSFLEKVST